jgi:hypothetical protein
MDLLTTEQTPMGDADIHRYAPTDKIFSYSQLAGISDIDQLFKTEKDSCFLLYEHSKNNGHWVCLCRYSDGNQPVIEFFDSYGGAPDTQLRWTPQQTRMGLGITRPFLTSLLKKAESDGFDIIHNKMDYQSENPEIATCGRHCCMRIKMLDDKNLTLDEYNKEMKQLRKNSDMTYDEIVSQVIPI